MSSVDALALPVLDGARLQLKPEEEHKSCAETADKTRLNELKEEKSAVGSQDKANPEESDDPHGMYIQSKRLACVCTLDVSDLLSWPEPASLEVTEFAAENSEESDPSSSEDEPEDPKVVQKVKELEEMVTKRDELTGHANRKKRQKLNQRIRAVEEELDRLTGKRAAAGDDESSAGTGDEDQSESESESEHEHQRRKDRQARQQRQKGQKGVSRKRTPPPPPARANAKAQAPVPKQAIAKDPKRKGRADSNEEEEEEEEDSGSGSESGSSGDSSSEDDGMWEEILFKLSRRYDFLQRLGASRDVAVYCVRDRKDNSFATLKVKAGLPSTQRIPKDVRVHLLLQQQSTLFPPVREFFRFTDHDCYAFAMPLLDNARIEKCIFGLPDADRARKSRKYMYDLLSAIQIMQRHNLLYRDVKSSNVLWCDHEERATVIDMDTATFDRGEKGHFNYYGTSGYMAPEMDREEKKPYGMEIDIWSAGVVLGQLLYRYAEDDITSRRCPDAKGEAFVRRAKAAESEGKASAGERLMVRMLDPDPKSRITVDEALKHDFFTTELEHAVPSLPPLPAVSVDDPNVHGDEGQCVSAAAADVSVAVDDPEADELETEGSAVPTLSVLLLDDEPGASEEGKEASASVYCIPFSCHSGPVGIMGATGSSGATSDAVAPPGRPLGL